MLFLAPYFRQADYLAMVAEVRAEAPALNPRLRGWSVWKFTDTFPMTVNGKIQKFKMREQSMCELGLERDG